MATRFSFRKKDKRGCINTRPFINKKLKNEVVAHIVECECITYFEQNNGYKFKSTPSVTEYF